IMTGTVSQNEEEYRAAEAAVALYGADRVIIDTYPDSFMAEQETTVSKLVAFASDPDVKAIIMCQGVPGAAPAFSKIREMGRDDILLIVGTPQEDPEVISSVTDIIMYQNEVAQGDQIIETLTKWGCDVFIHYSFPRHMAMELIVARHELLEKNAEALGILMVDETAPDPTAEAGMAASQQFILEDVPRQMEKYAGKKVAFFTTNCGMQVPLQTAILEFENAYYPTPCCPSPYHGFPSSLSLELDVAGGNEAALRKVAAKLAEYNGTSRYSTWAAPVAMMEIEIAAAYATEWIAGNITERNDAAAIFQLIEERSPGANVTLYTDVKGNELENFYLIQLAMVDFNDYL
ncbi:MAG: DUF3798 domain-containing protein, partial [Clostridia bacterium]|nr:DUF3798 domain-containing protein [Clostridia bacterium]